MEKLKEKEHDFSSKLRQETTLQRLREYILWQRRRESHGPDQPPPASGPVSINLDLTSACNFSCSFCVDSKLITAGKSLPLENLKRMIRTLHAHGLLSVILIGGGEPTLHKDFEEIVRYIKRKGLQVGIATNGSKLEKIEAVADTLKEKDWVRISIDAAEEGTYRKLHRPRTEVSLKGILQRAREIKEKNPIVSLGYSFVIIWKGVRINGKRLCRNTGEIVRSVELAGDFLFDYVSLKPCLIRQEESARETLLKDIGKKEETGIIDDIKVHVTEARRLAGGRIKILESPNLKAMLQQEADRIKRQPKRCHMQFFRTVATPSGIFHCPAFRGVEEARIGEAEGYASEKKFAETLRRTAQSIAGFRADEECRDVGCFYNLTNWWLEKLIRSDADVRALEGIENDNFFL